MRSLETTVGKRCSAKESAVLKVSVSVTDSHVVLGFAFSRQRTVCCERIAVERACHVACRLTGDPSKATNHDHFFAYRKKRNV